MMDAKQIKVSCDLAGLELGGCHDLCAVLEALWAYVQAHSGEGAALSVTLDAIDRNAPLANTVATSAACAPIGDYSWTIVNLATNQSYSFGGPGLTDASGEPYVVSGAYSLPLLDWNALGGELCNYRVTLTVTDSCNRFASDVKLTLLASGSTFRQRFAYSGADQVITVPACATKMRAKCWGGGGHSQSYLASHGAGAGGYTEAVIRVTPGETLRVMVGHGGQGVISYGFAGTTNQGVGGGLSGIFRKSNGIPLTRHDAGLALLIAGGGGGGDYAGTAQSRGGNGNDPQYSGGEPSMLGCSDNLDGVFAASYCGGGGGGYNGGTRHSRDSVQGSGSTLPYGGEGGAGFVIAGATDVLLLATPDGSPAAPNSSDPDYEAGIGTGGPGLQTNGLGGNGLIVVYWMTG